METIATQVLQNVLFIPATGAVLNALLIGPSGNGLTDSLNEVMKVAKSHFLIFKKSPLEDSNLGRMPWTIIRLFKWLSVTA